MSQEFFTKPPLSIAQQVEKLRERGLRGDSQSIEGALKRMSYYRFSGYLWWFYTEEWEKIVPETSVDDVLELYAFDATLRIHIMSLAHSIEVWLRAAMANNLALRHGAMGYLKPDLYHHKQAFRRDLEKLREMLGDDSPEQFVAAFKAHYLDEYPPVWMSVELMSIGLLSKWFDNLKEDSLRKVIAAEAGLPHQVLSSFFASFCGLEERGGAPLPNLESKYLFENRAPQETRFFAERCTRWGRQQCASLRIGPSGFCGSTG